MINMTPEQFHKTVIDLRNCYAYMNAVDELPNEEYEPMYPVMNKLIQSCVQITENFHNKAVARYEKHIGSPIKEMLESICILDFIGNIRGDDGSIIVYQGTYSADYEPEFKFVSFWGLLWGIPNMKTDTCPTEDEVWEHIMKYLESQNMTLDEWYKKADEVFHNSVY